jgi:hypothetical protein
MSELGTVPGGLMKATGSQVWWALRLSQVACNPMTGEFVIVFPLVNGVITMGLQDLGADGTGFVSGS